jgi:hypothetical protein
MIEKDGPGGGPIGRVPKPKPEAGAGLKVAIKRTGNSIVRIVFLSMGCLDKQ